MLIVCIVQSGQDKGGAKSAEAHGSNTNAPYTLELALEGERLCKSGDFKSGIAFLEAAVEAGTHDLNTLSAIYSQLGNAHFFIGEYQNAVKYHKMDLSVARCS